jgi:hypothetical protein
MIERTMSIEPLSPAVRDYLRAFDLVAIGVTCDGQIIRTRNPAGADAAWWCEARNASLVIRPARQHGRDIPLAAQALGVALTEHSVVLARAKAALAKIEAGMAWAQRSGVLHEFNQEYRRRRLEAQARGEPFMTYGAARARLRRAMMKVAATGSVPVTIVREVFKSGGRGCP